MERIEGVPVWGSPVDAGAVTQIKNCARDAAQVALMADHHLGYAVPIGGVVAYEDKISPSGVGFDIACGNKAVRTDMPASEARAKIKKIMDDIWGNLSFGLGRTNETPVDHELFDDETWKLSAVHPLKQMARNQLGTIGSGNHYVDLFADEQDRVWVGVHFGSRGLGHKTATYFLKAGGAKDGMMVDPLVLDVDSPLGSDYLACMTLAGRYAYAGRDWVCNEVARLLGVNILEEVHNHHNFCIAGDQKIPTPAGYKRMRDVHRGDIIYSFDREQGPVETCVLTHWHSGKKPVYTIRTRNRALRVSATHPVLVIRTEKRPHPERNWFDRRHGFYEWVQASAVLPGDALVCASGYYRNDQSIGEDLARFIGAYLGDGWLRQRNTDVSGYSVGLAIGARGERHTERYGGLCRTLFPGATWKDNAPGAFGISCSSKQVHVALSDMGVAFPSQDRRVPYFIFQLPLREKLAFLAGYFDADGSIAASGTSNYGRGAICSTSRELTEGIREVAIACGMQVTLVRQEEVESNFGSAMVYRCSISADSISLLELWHEGKASHQRVTKFQRGQGLQPSKIGYVSLPDGIFAQRVTSVTVSAEVEDVYDLTVEHPSHSFVCEGVVVHNCWKERHEGRDLWVVRKGATPAFPGQRGFVGGSMGDNSVILEGVDSDEGKDALYSTVHGAGRVMSRTAARGKIDRRTGKVIAPGAVSRQMMQDWLKKQNVELRGAGTDESPHCYKRIEQVLAHHAKSVRILHTLTPLGVAMAGENEVDPYKD